MSQGFSDTKPEHAVTTMGELYALIRRHNDALRSNFSGVSNPKTPTKSQFYWEVSSKKLNGYDSGTVWQDIFYWTKAYYKELNSIVVTTADFDADIDNSRNISLGASASGKSIKNFTGFRDGFVIYVDSGTSFAIDILTTGNIIPKGNVTLTMQLGDVAGFIYNSALAKWLQIYWSAA